MLNNLSEQIRECLQHAEHAQTDPSLKQDFLDLEQRWLLLARSYEFTDRLSDFSRNEAKSGRAAESVAAREDWKR